MSELNAALGLVQLGHVMERNAKRAQVVGRYRLRLAASPGISVPFQAHRGEPPFISCQCCFPRASTGTGDVRDAGCRDQTSIHYRPVDTFTALWRRGRAGTVERGPAVACRRRPGRDASAVSAHVGDSGRSGVRCAPPHRFRCASRDHERLRRSDPHLLYRVGRSMSIWSAGRAGSHRSGHKVDVLSPPARFVSGVGWGSIC